MRAMNEVHPRNMWDAEWPLESFGPTHRLDEMLGADALLQAGRITPMRAEIEALVCTTWCGEDCPAWDIGPTHLLDKLRDVGAELFRSGGAP